MKVKVVAIIGFLFIVACSARVVKTYQVDREEAIFEGFLLAAIAGYHGAALKQLSQEKEQQAE